MESYTYFISYTTRTENDIAWAKWACWVLENKLNAKTIMQEYDFHPGDNFKERMHDALKRTDFVLCVLTSTYMDSSNCTEEWTNADKIIPVKFDDCSPSGLLKSRVYINLYGLDRDAAREKLIAQIIGNTRPINEPDAPFAPTPSHTTEPEFPTSSHANESAFSAPSRANEHESPASYLTSARATKHNLPNRNKNFVGRDDILSKIYTGLQSSAIVSLIGAGGFGKTQIAVEYAHLHDSEYGLLWIFNAESEKRLQDDYREFAMRNLNLTDATEIEFSSVRREVDAWFRTTTSGLLLYDNVEGCPNLKEYIPTGHTQKHILINSRERVQGIVSDKLDIIVFSPNDAIDFLQKRIPAAISGEAAELAKALGYLPLALECAAAYIEENQYTLAQYQERWRRYKLAVLDTHATATIYEQTVLTTWTSTFEKIAEEAEIDDQTKAAVQLFRLCMYCAPDDIPLRLFIKGREKIPQPLGAMLDPDNEPKHDDIINKLSRYSLISMRRTGIGDALLTVHRLIQEAARIHFEQTKEWVNYCLEIADSVFDYQYGIKEEFDEFTANLPHVLEITRYGESIFDDEPQDKIARIYNEVGIGLHHQGDYAKAMEWYLKALAIAEKVLGTEHPDTATTYHNIAGIYRKQGDYPKALEWHSKALAIREKVLGTTHPDTAAAYNNIALVYDNQGDYAMALEWFSKALDIKEKVLGTEHPNTATTYNNIADVYREQGNYEKALEWFSKALAISEKVLGTEHPDTAATYNNIALVYDSQGDYAKALEWFSKALAICDKVLGTTHPNTAAAYNNIAGVYREQGNHEKALEWFSKALAIREKVLGTTHPDTAATYNNIAIVYDNQGDYAMALEWFSKALAIREKILGTEHPDTAATYNNIAHMYIKMGKYVEARDLFCRAAIVMIKCDLADHHHTKSAFDFMLNCYEKAGGKEEDFDAWMKERIETYPTWCKENPCNP
ncbi:MAG: toll/interleukin-1 receptor domain-containing protein [Peptococcaceae bacterium]|jgi:tetratricopeptide (TPR) repeat protein|nr:toll/interleukin-1 receptor domain-containing protein [Peptococcaceae bacterium]